MSDISEKQIKRLRKLLQEAETSVACAKELLVSLVGEEEDEIVGPTEATTGKVMEGVFDGRNMLGPDGKTYPVQANYASKSKLVQGDILKLTIGDDGRFIYKQIGPVPRAQLVGTLDEHGGQYFVTVDGNQYNVLLASVTYFKAQKGDQVSILVPEDDEADWAAIEALL